MIRQFELVEKVKAYDPNVDENLLNRAYVFSMKAHGAQKRESGDPYFSHPLEVAGILSDMKLDLATIITGLLHDTIEDTIATLPEIKKQFGDEIATLVDGVTKLSRLELQSDKTKQAENFRKLVLAMSNDIRVLLVKLADRLHNMKTLHFVKSEEKRKRIARETLEIYAPLAGRLGIHHFKEELEDSAFKILNPDARDSIITRLRFLEHEADKNLIEDIIKELKDILAKNHLKADISGRMKTPYSIWLKMRRKNIAFEQLSDIMAFRVLVKEVQDCYQALGIIHSNYPVVPGRFKDYISTPKPNNYQSLHTTIIGPKKQRIEVQIRTELMHAVSEYGVAAHWHYKEGKDKSKGDHKEYQWLRSLLEILEHASGPEEFLEHTKLEMFQDQVFCFTPAGDLISLPRGATPIDFAYAIHSEVGNHCVGAKINGRMAPLRTILNNGDQVEITTSKTQTPSPTWERFVVTGKASANIRKFIRTQQRTQYINLGRSILTKSFQHEHLSFSEKDLEKVCEQFDCISLDDLYALIGEGRHTSYEIIRAVHPEYTLKSPPKAKEPGQVQSRIPDSVIAIRGLIPGMAVHFARCCHPLPGDKIVGIIVTGKGVTIHTYDCENLNNFAEEPERWIDVAWDSKVSDQEIHIGRLNITMSNQQGALATITTIISKNHANIVNLKFTNRSENFFEVLVDLEVKNSEHLSNVIAALRSLPIVSSVDRAKS
jgi:GTP pyrophosphokinase